MQTHKDLDIWKRGIKLVTQVYSFTSKFPCEELYGLVSQMRRAAVSFPSNIAEGAARNTKADYTRFVYIALGSLSELETQVIISKNLGYASDTDITEDIDILRKMTIGFIKHLKSRNER